MGGHPRHATDAHCRTVRLSLHARGPGNGEGLDPPLRGLCDRSRGWRHHHWRCVVFFRQRALDSLRDESQSRLEAATDALETLIRTQPPAEFQQMLGVYYEKALVGCDAAQSVEELASSIAVVVEGLAKLARFFDNGPTNESAIR